MSNFKFSQKSLSKLQSVHPDLVKVVTKALDLSKVDFSVLEGLRSFEQQKKYIRDGVSKTMKSKHLPQKDGYSHAVDLIPYPVNWNLTSFYPIALAMLKASKELGIKIRWGGCWENITNFNSPEEAIKSYKIKCRAVNKIPFIDAPHFELIM